MASASVKVKPAPSGFVVRGIHVCKSVLAAITTLEPGGPVIQKLNGPPPKPAAPLVPVNVKARGGIGHGQHRRAAGDAPESVGDDDGKIPSIRGLNVGQGQRRGDGTGPLDPVEQPLIRQRGCTRATDGKRNIAPHANGLAGR